MRAIDARFIAGGAVALAVDGYRPFRVHAVAAGHGTRRRPERLDGRHVGIRESAGSLVGASLAMHPITHANRLAILRWSLAGVVVTTALMAAGPLWLPLRFITGVCSGLVFVFASSIVLERAAHARAPSWPPLFFTGVGLGIASRG